MRQSQGIIYLVVGITLMVLSVVLAMLMVVQTLRSTFLLNAFAYGASFVGFLLGVVGVAYYVRAPRRRQ